MYYVKSKPFSTYKKAVAYCKANNLNPNIIHCSLR